jgi:hypothetical protein
MTRGDTTNSWGRQEASTPEKKRSTTRGYGTMRSGQVEVSLNRRRWHDKKLRRRRTRDNMATSQGRREA